MIAKPLPEDVAVIMVAHQQPQGNLKPGKVALEVIKSLSLAPVCQVSGDDTTLRIRVIPIDIVDTALKRCCRITAIQRSALGNKVGIGLPIPGTGLAKDNAAVSQQTVEPIPVERGRAACKDMLSIAVQHKIRKPQPECLVHVRQE